jgi:hypothetical protein
MARLRRVLAERVGDGTPDSLLALKVARILKPRFGPFETNYVAVVGGEVVEMDIAWPDIKLDGEVDGLGVRRLSRTKFERERRRANVLAAHGWRIVHFTDKMGQREIVAQVAPFFAGRIGRAGGGRGG